MNIVSLKMKSFWVNETFFKLMMLVYNIFLIFKLDNLASCEYRQFVKTFRFKYVFLAGKVIKTAHQTILKMLKDYPYKSIYHRLFLVFF